MNKNIVAIILVSLGIIVGYMIFQSKPVTNQGQNSIGTLSQNSSSVTSMPLVTSLPTPSFDLNMKKKYAANLKTTLGIITIELFSDKTPVTVNNFVSLSKNDFYNNTIFHRVIKDFMIQGGDPKGDGTGGPGYTFADEKFGGEYSRGTVAMANAGPNTNGSQFFIIHKDTPLPKNYVIFGKVISGIEIVDKIATSPVETNLTGENSKPVNPIVITTVEITEK